MWAEITSSGSGVAVLATNVRQGAVPKQPVEPALVIAQTVMPSAATPTISKVCQDHQVNRPPMASRRKQSSGKGFIDDCDTRCSLLSSREVTSA
jgi:hypothetical protein